MKSASVALANYLAANNKFLIADLFQLTPVGSLVNLNPNPQFANGAYPPTGWAEYNNTPGLEPITGTRVAAGPNGGDFYTHQIWSVNNTSSKGISATGGQVVYTPMKQYQVVWQARATGTNVGQQMQLAWNTAPAITINDVNPPLTGSWQAYVFRITWGASVDPNTYISILYGGLTQGSLDIADVVITDTSTTMRWTSADQNILGYSSTGPIIHHSGMRQVRGKEVPNFSVTLDVGTRSDAPLFAGTSLPLAAMQGKFDGASFRMDRIFMPTAGDITLGTVPKFYGVVATVAPSSSVVKLTVAGELKKLNNFMLPRVIYQPSCMHSLYDAGCGVARVPVATTLTVSTTTASVVVNDASATGTWNLGTIKLLANNEVRSIRTSTLSGTNTLALNVPLSAIPNQTTNPGLEIGPYGTGASLAPGWIEESAGFCTIVNGGHSGTYAIRMAAGGGTYAVRNNQYPTPVVPGQTFIAMAYLKASATLTSGGAYLRMTGRNSVGTEIWTPSAANVVATTWTLTTVTAVVPANVVNVTVETVSSNPVGADMLADDFILFRADAILLLGCDKAALTCNNKFSNIQRFRGYPYIPKPENAR